MNTLFRLVLPMLAAATVGACGGGGGSGPAAPVLSETQKAFEETALASNGGSHNLFVNWTTSLPVGTATTVNIILIGAGVGKFELARSPAGETAGVTASVTPATDLIASVPTPAGQEEANENAGDAFIHNGQIRFVSAKTPGNYRYEGDDILVEVKAPTGEVLLAERITGHAKVALIGKATDAPQEFRDLYGAVASYISATTTFAPGAAYYKRVAKRVGEHLFLFDADNNNATDPKSATARYTGTLEQFAASFPLELNLPSGAIKTVKGARCWVASQPLTGSSVSPTYFAHCEVSGLVYRANLQADGAERGAFYPTGLVSPSFARYPFRPRLNKAAVDSIKAMLR